LCIYDFLEVFKDFAGVALPAEASAPFVAFLDQALTQGVVGQDFPNLGSTVFDVSMFIEQTVFVIAAAVAKTSSVVGNNGTTAAVGLDDAEPPSFFVAGLKVDGGAL
jgi:hypothetical protein